MSWSLEEFAARAKQAEQSREAEPWSWDRRVGSAARAAWNYVASGFARVSPEQYEKRRATCATCSHWQGRRCDICGCLVMKLYLPSERCPAGKWEVVGSAQDASEAPAAAQATEAAVA